MKLNPKAVFLALLCVICSGLFAQDTSSFEIPAVPAPVKDSTFSLSIDSTTARHPASTTIITPETQKVQFSKGGGMQPMNAVVNNGYAVGEIPFTTNVSNSGAFTQSIPLEVTPGINGCQPTLAAVYNSQGGEGEFGFKWSLSGISSIKRRAKLFYLDGQTSAVSVLKTDQDPPLSLDGQRLIAVDKSPALTVYYPEMNNSIKVVLSKTVSGNNYNFSSLKAYYPDGSTMEFEVNLDDLQFPVKRYTDKYGNYIDYIHYKTANNELKISEIKYGGNLTAGSSHFASVLFTYSNRQTYPKIHFEGGASIPLYSILDHIYMYYNGVEQRKYNFDYESATGAYTQPWHVYLTSGGVEVPKLLIEHGTQTPLNISQSTSTLVSAYADMSYTNVNTLTGRFAYFDQSDQLLVYPKRNSYQYGNQSGITASHTGYHPNDKIFVYLDLNSSYSFPYELALGDGFRDILVGNMDNQQEDEIVKINATGSYFGQEVLTVGSYSPSLYGGLSKLAEKIYYLPSPYSYNGYSTAMPRKNFFGDFDGDGKNEVFSMEICNMLPNQFPGASKFYIFDINSANTVPEYSGYPQYGFNLMPEDAVFTGDYDGDGKTDIFLINANGLGVYSFKFNGGTGAWPYNLEMLAFTDGVKSSDLAQKTFFPYVYRRQLFTGDINGDGKLDMMLSAYCRKTSGNYFNYTSGVQWVQCLSSGAGVIHVSHHNLGACSNDGHTKMVDVDGDGQSDIVTIYNNQAKVVYSDGSKINSNTLRIFNVSGINNLANTAVANIKEYDSKLYLLSVYTDVQKIKFNRSEAKECLISKINSGLGMQTVVNYGYLDDGTQNYFTPGYGASFPYSNLYGHMPIAVCVKMQAGSTVFFDKNYSYSNAIYHRQGIGFTGFQNTYVYDNLRGAQMSRQFLPEKFGLLLKEETPSKLTSNTWQVTTASDKQTSIRLETQEDFNKLTNQTNTTTSQYDIYGNLTSVERNYNNQYKEIGVSQYSNITTNQWLIGLPLEFTATVERNGQSWTKKRTYNYNGSFLVSNQTDYINGNKSSESDYTYDQYGNILTKADKPFSSTAILTNSFTYSPNGWKRLSETNPLGQTSEFTYNSRGLLASSEDFKGNITSYEYEAFDRITKTVFPNGVTQDITRQWEDGSEADSKYAVIVTATGAPQKHAYYDVAAREVRAKTQRFNGGWLIVDKEYYTNGDLYRTSDPYSVGDTKVWITNIYDNYGRVISIASGSGSSTAYSYQSNQVTETISGIAKTKTFNSAGELLSVTDATGTIAFNLRPDGQPASIVAPGNIITSFTYDNYGRKIGINDPSGGSLTYGYDVNGNVNIQTDANGKSISTTYDNLRRLLSRTSPEFTTTYTYDNDGWLSTVSSTNGTTQTYQYDNLGRVSQKREEIGTEYYQANFTYQADKLSQVTHLPINYTVKYNYNVYGYLNNLTDINNVNLYTINQVNARGQEIQATLGNGIEKNQTYDDYGFLTNISQTKGSNVIQNNEVLLDRVKGNVSSRTDLARSLTEAFTYDGLNRLVSYGLTSAPHTVQYDNTTGNIAEKTDAGTYEYNLLSKPYAVTDVKDNFGSITSFTQDVSYTSFARASEVVENTYRAEFLYNSAHERNRMQVFNNNTLEFSRYYFNAGIYEKTINTSGTTTELLYMDGSPYTASVVVEKVNGSARLLFVGRDHLGSITHITDANGLLLEEYSYDAWGRMRNPSTLVVYTPGSEPNLLLHRGYTGHEHLPWFGLINMNARLYDPVLGRMLSADPYVINTSDAQLFNRYSYGVNNPLIYTDPDGEWIHILVGAVLGGVVNLTVKALQGKVTSLGEGLKAFGVGAVAGGVGAATGGMAFTAAGGAAAGTGGFVAGLAGGAAGSAIASPIQGIGNAVFFGDSYSPGQWFRDVLIGGVAGGLVNGTIASFNGKSFWTGQLLNDPYAGIAQGVNSAGSTNTNEPRPKISQSGTGDGQSSSQVTIQRNDGQSVQLTGDNVTIRNTNVSNFQVKNYDSKTLWEWLTADSYNGTFSQAAKSGAITYQSSNLTFTYYIAESTKQYSIVVYSKELGKEILKLRF